MPDVAGYTGIRRNLRRFLSDEHYKDHAARSNPSRDTAIPAICAAKILPKVADRVEGKCLSAGDVIRVRGASPRRVLSRKILSENGGIAQPICSHCRAS